jgi:hypothetical protein
MAQKCALPGRGVPLVPPAAPTTRYEASDHAMMMRMQPMSERTRLSFPRYRIEERTPDMAATIVGFADTSLQSETLLTRRAAQLIRARVWAELVVIDQAPTRSSFVAMNG